MKCFIVSAVCLVAAFSFTQGMTIHLLDIAAQQSSIEDGSLLTRFFFSKNITGRIAYTTELDGHEEVQPTQKIISKTHKDSSEKADPSEEDGNEIFDSWSIVWYIASFSGLILFFLIVSCSEWCCRNRIRRQQQQNQQATTSTTSQTDMRVIATRSQPEQQAPPSYDQFAPPSYDSLIGNIAVSGGEMKKGDYEVYVVPVHTMTTMVSGAVEGESVSSAPPLTPSGMEEAPPSYAVLNMETTTAPGQEHSAAHAPRC